MTQYDDKNRGILFINDKKETEKHPDFKGSINVNGKEFWLSGWKKVIKNGSKVISVSIQPKDDRQSSQPTRKAKADDFDDF